MWFSNAFEPEEVAKLKAALDLACAEPNADEARTEAIAKMLIIELKALNRPAEDLAAAVLSKLRQRA